MDFLCKVPLEWRRSLPSLFQCMCLLVGFSQGESIGNYPINAASDADGYPQTSWLSAWPHPIPFHPASSCRMLRAHLLPRGWSGTGDHWLSCHRLCCTAILSRAAPSVCFAVSCAPLPNKQHTPVYCFHVGPCFADFTP